MIKTFCECGEELPKGKKYTIKSKTIKNKIIVICEQCFHRDVSMAFEFHQLLDGMDFNS